jgi:hypothetical protein
MSNPMQDQWDAATEDARRRLHTVNPGTPVTVVDLRDDAEKGPRENMLAHILGHYTQEDASAACEHVRGGPKVVFGAASFPGKVFCGDCFQVAWKLYSAVWQQFGMFTPCDNCHGKPVPGNVPGSSTGVVNFGPIMLTISLCADCTRDKEIGGD